ncbi:pro-thyrotropin-releasing hormone [Hippocampus zosterae]|uniref:pro-thyrotropin-releasing hormone n=1 Tax=Hippocampus zosterae TaxID=109293 RepID=UPI00223E686B|nr:pro-thyrotropin-releasing hormone [Hippocampus zosterae]
MKWTRLLFLACVLLCNLTAARGGARSISSEEEPDPRTAEDLLLRRAESLLLRSVLRKMQAQDDKSGEISAQAAWVTKRQHPGKRRTEDGAEEADEEDSDVERRQHPGKRAAAAAATGRPPATLAQGEPSKRQHPGKRYAAVTRSRRQHPGKRQPDREDDEDDEDDEEEEEAEEEEREEEQGEHRRLPDLHRRQHPGKRFWDRAASGPCEYLRDPARCAESDLLLHFLDRIGDVKRGDEKRQHPGKRFAPEEEQ